MAGTVGPHSPRSHLGQPVTACYLPVTRCRPAPPVIPYGAICLRADRLLAPCYQDSGDLFT